MAKSSARTRRGETLDSWEVAAPSIRMAGLPDKLGVCIRFAQNQVFREFANRFAAFSVTPLLYSVLTLIGANPGCRQSDVGAALSIKQPNLVEKIDTLVERGLVTRTPDPSDRRANVLTLTAAGRRFLDDLIRTDDDLCADFEARLGPEDHATLLKLLKRLVQIPGV